MCNPHSVKPVYFPPIVYLDNTVVVIFFFKYFCPKFIVCVLESYSRWQVGTLSFNQHLRYFDARNLSLAALNMGLVEKYESLPSPEQLDLIPLNCPSSIFLEVLTGYIWDAIISLQSWTRKVDNVKKICWLNKLTLSGMIF